MLCELSKSPGIGNVFFHVELFCALRGLLVSIRSGSNSGFVTYQSESFLVRVWNLKRE